MITESHKMNYLRIARGCRTQYLLPQLSVFGTVCKAQIGVQDEASSVRRSYVDILMVLVRRV